jgi:hypothetical protein
MKWVHTLYRMAEPATRSTAHKAIACDASITMVCWILVDLVERELLELDKELQLDRELAAKIA